MHAPDFPYLLEMPVAKTAMQIEGGLPDLTTPSPDALLDSHRLALFVFLCRFVAIELPTATGFSDSQSLTDSGRKTLDLN